MGTTQIGFDAGALPASIASGGLSVGQVWQRSPALAWLTNMPWPAAWYAPGSADGDAHKDAVADEDVGRANQTAGGVS